jgi:hypothetical protein
MFRALAYIKGHILHVGPSYNGFVSSLNSHKEWKHSLNTHFDFENKSGKTVISEWERRILQYDEEQLQTVRSIKSLKSYGRFANHSIPDSNNTRSSIAQIYNQIDETEGPRLFLGTTHIGLVPPGSEP